MIESLRSKILIDSSSFPMIELHSGDYYLGEFPWLPEISELDHWNSYNDLQKFSVPTRPTVASYTCSSQGYDCSVDKTIRVIIPAPWLSKAMGLRLSSGRSLIFVNSDGRETFYDPSVVEPGRPAALVDRDTFLDVLDRQRLSAIWVIAGQKNALSGSDASPRFGGRLNYTALYNIKDESFSCCLYTNRIHPTKRQLREFFGKGPIPLGMETRPTDP